MLTIFVRALALYLFAVVAMRLMGKRQVGQLQPYELVLAIMIADLAATPIGAAGVPLLYGIVPILGLLFIHALITVLSVKWPGFRLAVSGGPSVLIRRGVVQYKEMKRVSYTVSDLLEELRAQGYLNIADVCTAILETNGTLSVFPHAENRPYTPKDAQISVAYEGIPLTLIVDGRVQADHLSRAGVDEQWLRDKMSPLGFQGVKDILLASVDTQGKLFVQGKRDQDKMYLIDALSPEKAVW